jgi:hypothetical protein
MLKTMKLGLALILLPLPVAAIAAQDVSVPFSLTTGRPVLVLTRADGTVLEAVLDTGGQGAVITKSLADALKLDVVGKALIGSPYGGQPLEAELVGLPPLSLGGFALAKLEAVVLPDAQLPKGSPGLTISSVQFGERAYVLDFAKNQLVVPDKANGARSGWHILDGRNMPVTEIAIGSRRTRLVIDTGNPGSLVLPRDFAVANKAKLSDKPVGQIRTIDAAFDRYTATFNRDATIAGRPVRLAGLSVVDGMGANMGSKALAGFQLTIDKPNRRWRLDRTDGKTPVIGAAP